VVDWQTWRFLESPAAVATQDAELIGSWRLDSKH
jgi:hypothetical protein